MGFSGHDETPPPATSNSRLAKKQRLSPHSSSRAARPVGSASGRQSMHQSDAGSKLYEHDAFNRCLETEFDVPDSDEDKPSTRGRAISTPLGRSPALLKPRGQNTIAILAKSSGINNDLLQLSRNDQNDWNDRKSSKRPADLRSTKKTMNKPSKQLHNTADLTASSSNSKDGVHGVPKLERNRTVDITQNLRRRGNRTADRLRISAISTVKGAGISQISQDMNPAGNRDMVTDDPPEHDDSVIAKMPDRFITTQDLNADKGRKPSRSIEQTRFFDIPTAPQRPSTETPRKRKLKDRLMESSLLLNESSASLDENDESLMSDFLLESSPRKIGSSTKDKGGDPSDVLPVDIDITSLPVQGSQRGKTTYGGQRSYLSDLVEDTDPLLDTRISDLPEVTPHTRRILDIFQGRQIRASGDVVHLRDSDDEPEISLRNVHELKAAGQMRRSALESDALIDDILQSDSKSQKRGAVFRLAQRLLDQKFRESFVRNGLHDSFLAINDLEFDQFGDAAIHMSAYTIFKTVPTTDLTSIRVGKDLVRSCRTALASEQPLLSMSRERRANLSRVHQADLSELCSKFIEQEGQNQMGASQLTSRFLALKCLSVIVDRLGQGAYVRQVTGDDLFSTLASAVASNIDRDLNSYFDRTGQTLSLSILEMISVHKLPSSNNGHDLPRAAVRAMGRILVTMIAKDLDEEGANAYPALRVCLNITTSSNVNAQNLAEQNLIELVTRLVVRSFKDFEYHFQSEQLDFAIERLVLCLGFLINLTEKIDRNRLLFLQDNSSNSSCLDRLLDIFERRHEAAATAMTESESRINVTFGYIVILICCLCLNTEARRKVGRVLQDPDLIKIRGDMAQFVIFNRKISTDSSKIHESEESQHNPFVDRMEQVLRALTIVCKSEAELGNQR